MYGTEYSLVKKYNYLWKFCKFLALVPTCGFNVICTQIVFLCGYGVYVYGHCTNNLIKSVIFLLRIIDNASVTFLTIAVMTITLSAWFKRRQYMRFLLNLERFDKNLRIKDQTKGLVFRVLATNLATLAVLAMDYMAYGIGFGMGLYKFYVPRDINWCVMNYGIFIMCFLARKISKSFEALNACLVKDHFQLVTTFKTKGHVVKDFRKLYSDLYDAVDEYNNLFGLNWLFVFIFNVSIIVQYVQMVIVFCVYQKMQLSQLYMVMDSVLWVAKTAIELLYVASICDGLARQSRRTIAICVKLLSTVPPVPRTDFELVLREELMFVMKQAESRVASVSAAGFFCIDLRLMGPVVGSVTSYIIIGVQFLGGDKDFGKN